MMTNYLQCQLYIWVWLPWIFSYCTLLQIMTYEPSHHKQNGIMSLTSLSSNFFRLSTLLWVTGSLSTTASPTHTSQLPLSHFPSKTAEYITCYQCCHSFSRNNQEIGTYPRLLAGTHVWKTEEFYFYSIFWSSSAWSITWLWKNFWASTRNS